MNYISRETDGSFSLVFSSDASNRDDLSENEIRRKHKHKRNHPNLPKLLRREVIWIQCFHWPKLTTCGKYPCAFVMPERYFIFTCCSANGSISDRARKMKNFDAYACADTCVKAVFTPPFTPTMQVFFVCYVTLS